MSAPWMPLYVADYLADTTRLSTVEHGAYMLLIMDYWRNGGLPVDDSKLARIVRMTPTEWLEIRDNVAELFRDDWTHKRIDDELANANAKTERRVEAGRRGGLAKAASNPSNATILPEQKHSNALASSSQPQSDNSSLRSELPRKARETNGSRLPPDWSPAEGQPTNSLELAKFRDYWTGLPGARGRKADWDATWRNWLRRAAENQPRAGPGQPPKDSITAALAAHIRGMTNEPALDQHNGPTLDLNRAGYSTSIAGPGG